MPSLPEPIQRYVDGAVPLEQAVHELQALFPNKAFNFSPEGLTPTQMLKAMEFMKGYVMAVEPQNAAAVSNIDPAEMARIAEHMRKYGRPPDK